MPRSKTKLGDLLELVIDHRGKTPKKLGGDFTNQGVPVVSAIHIKNGQINWAERERFVSQQMFEKWMQVRLQKDDVLLTSEAPLGEVALVESNNPLVLSQRLFALRCRATVIDPKFLKHFLSSPVGQKLLYERASGSTVLGIKQSELLQIEIPMLPISQQVRVGSFLERIDSKIRLNQRMSSTLEGIAQTIFKSWFIDFDPVHAKARGEQPEGMDAETAALFPDSFEDSELGPIPAGWTVKPVGGLLTPKKGKVITKANTRSGAVPVVAGGLEPAYYHDTSNVEGPVVTVSSSGANAGFVRLYTENIWASDCIYVSKNETDFVYFWYTFLKLRQNEIWHMQQGGAQPHIYASDLMRIVAAFPEVEALLSRFETLVSPLFELIETGNSENKTLTEIRDSLLPRLISGELEIPEELLGE